MYALCRKKRRLTAPATLLLALTACAGMPAVDDGPESADTRPGRDGFYVVEAERHSRSPAPARGVPVETFGNRIRISEFRRTVRADDVWVTVS